MKFDPVIFIKIANRNGITLTRTEDNTLLADNLPEGWSEAIRKHKRQLIKYLPANESKRLQTDIFYYND